MLLASILRNRYVRWGAPVVVLIAVGLGVRSCFRSGATGEGASAPLTYEVHRGNLTVTVLEGGTIKALRSLDIKSQVEGQTRILSIIPEGTLITQEDIDKGTVLVELDAADLEEKRSQADMSFQSAQASYTQALESFQIQKQQNESNITLAELKVKFAHMDLEHYLGAALAAAIGDMADLRDLGQRGDLAGSALQEKRRLEANVDLAREELSRAQDKLEWTRKLVDKGYVNRNELDADQLAVKRCNVTVEQAQLELQLFLEFALPKEIEQLHSDDSEAQRELERTHAKARSQLAQAEAELKSREAALQLQKERLDRIVKDISNCVIRATKPGMVLYASTVDPRAFQDNPIQEGFVVRERQSIITLPDLSTLAVNLSVHETDVKKVHVGQPARITVGALSGESFRGHVVKVSVLGSSEQRWLNPDMMLYSSDVAIDDPSSELKPSMSASVEIIVAELKDVLFVPIQAVTTRAGKRVCYVEGRASPEPREVDIGYLTDKYIEIRSGLSEGDLVYLSPPGKTGTEKEVEPSPVESPPALAAEAAVTAEPTPRPTAPAEGTVTPQQTEENQPGTEATPRRRARREQMSPEERQRWEQMSPEERERAMQRMRERPGTTRTPAPTE